MESIYNVSLILHIVSGAVGLLTGFVNIFRKKGDKNHKLVGKLFSYSMLTTGFTSLLLSVIHPNYFLFIVGVFTLYLVGTGYRYIYFKMRNNDAKPKSLDYLITYTMLITGALFSIFGIWNIIYSNFFGIVFLMFGGISLGFVRADLKNYKGTSNVKNFWLTAHLQRMTGAFIAALTAFLVVNAKYFPDFIPLAFFWMLPTAILVPFIVKWSRKYKIKTNNVDK